MATSETEILVIGAGPIGIETAVALKQAGLDYIQIEKRQIGQTVWWYPAQTKFFSSIDRIAISGMPIPVASGESKATREEYLAYLRAVVTHFDLNIRVYEKAVSIEKCGDGFRVWTDSMKGRNEIFCRKLILTTGDMNQPNLLGIPGEELPHVSHYFHDAHPYFKRKVLVVGGKNSAVEAALKCHYIGAEVIISYRQDGLDKESIKYWLYPEISSLIKNGKIRAIWNSSPISIDQGFVTLETDDGVVKVDTDFVLLLTGFRMDHSLFEMLELETVGESGTPLLNEDTMESSVPGVYVAGTATAGFQKQYKVFIENSHVHVERILAHLTGKEPPEATTRKKGLEE
ncbi:MAG: NAD(P)-binding domain-containing protein [Planctomycetes bacterium]|nr:NAD(P)-binding domain-containing protein [Planctomycetota bacterium]